MNKQKIMLIISLLMTLSAISQTSTNKNDSITCIPNSQLKKAINLIEEGKVVKEELSLTKKKVENLESLSKVKDSTISAYKRKDADWKKIYETQEQINNNNKQIINNLNRNVALNGIRLKRQKIKKWLTFPLGVATGFLIFHK